MYKKGPTGDFFFFIFPKKKFFFSKNGQISYQKKNGIFFFAAARLAIITATRWTGNRLFFVHSLGRSVYQDNYLLFPSE